MARNQIATDNFTNLNNFTQTNGWDGSLGLTTTGYVVGTSSNTILEMQTAVWSGSGTFTDDQYASLVLKNMRTDLDDGYGIGVMVRSSTDVKSTATDTVRDFFGVYVDTSATNVTVLYKVVNGTLTQLHSAAATWATNDRVELEVEGQSPNIILRVCKNGTPLGGSFTQTGVTGPDTGKPGVLGMGDGNDTMIAGEDFVAGTLSSASVPLSAIQPSFFGFNPGFGR